MREDDDGRVEHDHELSRRDGQARPRRRGGEPADAVALDAAALLTTRRLPASGDVADKTILPSLKA
jgi:hypothetical protein